MGGGWEGKGKCRYILKTINLDIASSSLWYPLGAGSREEREPGITRILLGHLSAHRLPAPPVFFFSLFVNKCV